MHDTDQIATTTGKHGVELGTVLEQSRTNAKQIEQLAERLDHFADKVTGAIENLSLRIGREGKTNWQTVFMGCSFVMSLLAYPIYRQHEDLIALDKKLQNEFALALETTKETTKALGDSTKEKTEALKDALKERNEALVKLSEINRSDIKVLEAHERESFMADLNELRQRRLNDSKGKP